jgi:hypothetical protein
MIVWILVGWIVLAAVCLAAWVGAVLYSQHRQHRRRPPAIWLHRD